MGIYNKDPDATLDFAFDWSEWLAGDTIDDFDVTVAPSSVTIASSSENAGVVTVWLSGGEADETYRLTCTIETAGGRTDLRRMNVTVRTL